MNTKNINFGGISFGTNPPPKRNLIIANSGRKPLTIFSCNLAGTNPEQFSILGGYFGIPSSPPSPISLPAFPVVLPPNTGIFTFSVQFSPKALSAFSASINVVSDDPTTPTITISLTGSGELKIGNLRATEIRDGVVLTWDPIPTEFSAQFSTFKIYRGTECITNVSGLNPIGGDSTLKDPKTVTFTDNLLATGKYIFLFFFCGKL